MLQENREIIKQLFNLGKLKMADAAYYANKGYQIICKNGKVEEVILPHDTYLRWLTKAFV